MSGVLAKASQLKPEIRLAQAISHFEADLSNEQKDTFRTLRSESLNSPPGPSDVMRFTAEIDRQKSRKDSGRCFGPRFTNFLQGVQQFAALGDIIVGGSQNIIACGIWSLVRMSLLSIMSLSSHIEKLSTLFMVIGCSIPRHQTMALLYIRSKNLQYHLFEYFIVVVRLCQYLFKFTQKSVLQQVTSALIDSEIKEIRSDLDLRAELIKEEISLLVAKKIEEEALENSRFRALSSKLSKSAAYQQKLATKIHMLDFCSKYDYETSWKQIRKIGNSTLFTQLIEYHEWRDCLNSCTLLFRGKLGSGKSVLLANIVDDLNIHIRNDKIVIAYFFCRYDNYESLQVRTILGSLARQLLCIISDLDMMAEIYEEICSTENTEKVLELLYRGFPLNYKAYFILDGLDECGRLEREVLIQHLQNIQKRLNLLLLISFREESNNELSSIAEQLKYTWTASTPDENPDIEAFIEAELARCLESRKLVIGDPTLILNIQDTLLQGSQGMFLWVALQIQSLCGIGTDQAIQDALADLPRDLSETFTRILHGSQQGRETYQKPILELITVAYRPLTVDELREALSVTSGDAVWMPSKLLNDVYSALACCGCLLIIDEEDTTIRFVHHSVKQYLLDSSTSSSDMIFTVEKAHRTMADIIVTYLNYGIFGTEITTSKVPQIRIQSTPSRIIQSTMGSSSSVQNVAIKLLKSRKQPDFNIGKTLAAASNVGQSQQVEKFYFYSYATSFGLQHMFYVSGKKTTIYNLSVQLLGRNRPILNASTSDIWLPLVWAVENENEMIVKLLLETGKVSIESKEGYKRTPLSRAAANGYKAVVKLLLETGKVDIESKAESKQTPLSWAAANGHEAVVKLLLETDKVDVESKDESKRTPLSWAAANGHEAVVKLLLETGKTDVESKDWSEETPLSWAAANGYKAVVKLLLETGKVDVESKDRFEETPLSRAAANGYEEVVKLLLETGKVDMESKDESKRTPLWWAAANGHEAVVKLLLETDKVDVESKDESKRTPLWQAAANGYEAVVKLLLETGKADFESKDESKRTPLWQAAANGHGAVVKLLLETGKVDVESKDQFKETLLSRAAANGHEAVVKLLLETGKADVKSKDWAERTPLSQAAANGHEAIVKLLLETGKADVESKDWAERTPLSQAAANGHEAIVKLLLETGKADVESKDWYIETLLSWAAVNGYEAVVKLLLETGKADVESKDESKRTPLSWAAANGYETVVKLLLETGKADVESKDWSEETPLSWAAANGHEAVVKLLLETGKADVESKDWAEQTPLSRAAANGHEAVVKLLLETGKVDVESKDRYEQTVTVPRIQSLRQS